MKMTITDTNPIPTGEYVAQVLEIEQQESEHGWYFKWVFEILRPEEHAGRPLIGCTSTSASLKGKFSKWAVGCLGRKIEAGEVIDTDDLVGSKVTLVVTVKEAEDGSEYNRIDGVKAYKKTRAADSSRSTGNNTDDDPFSEA